MILFFRIIIIRSVFTIWIILGVLWGLCFYIVIFLLQQVLNLLGQNYFWLIRRAAMFSFSQNVVVIDLLFLYLVLLLEEILVLETLSIKVDDILLFYVYDLVFYSFGLCFPLIYLPNFVEFFFNCFPTDLHSNTFCLGSYMAELTLVFFSNYWLILGKIG